MPLDRQTQKVPVTILMRLLMVRFRILGQHASSATTRATGLRATPSDGTTTGPFAEDVVTIANDGIVSGVVSATQALKRPHLFLQRSDADGTLYQLSFSGQWAETPSLHDRRIGGSFPTRAMSSLARHTIRRHGYGTPVRRATISNTVPSSRADRHPRLCHSDDSSNGVCRCGW